MVPASIISKMLRASRMKKLMRKDRENEQPSEKEILDAIFRTLVKILSLEDDRTKSYALHGLSNCHHPGVKPTVQAIIDQHLAHYKDDVEFIEWLELCRDGKIP